jgi:hypothetical protein
MAFTAAYAVGLLFLGWSLTRLVQEKGILFPMLIGGLLDKYKELGNVEVGDNILFIICGFTYLVAWLIIHLWTKKVGKVSL